MSLSRSLDIARSHLSSTAEYMQTVSRNIARSGDPTATRKSVHYITTGTQIVRLGTITRSTDEILLYRSLTSTSEAGRDKSVLDALNQLNEVVGDTENETTPALLIQKLERSLQFYSDNPQDLSRAQSALRTAQDVASGLNEGSHQAQLVRKRADQDIGNSISGINALLERFETLNNEIVNGTPLNRDVTDQMDERDAIVAQLAEQMGIRTELRDNNDMAVRTDSGVTLFDTTARKLSFQAIGTFSAATTGNTILAGGVPIAGPNAIIPVKTGRLAGLIKVRDVDAVQFQAQLDEVARGLIEAFAEQRQVGAGPDQTGLFTWSGGPNVPPSGVRVSGLAAAIGINAAVDPAQGGDVTRIRDGGINGANYLYNTSGGAGFGDRLLGLGDQIAQTRSFDASAGLATTASLTTFAASSDGWLAAQRQVAQSSFDYTSVVYERSVDALNKVTGINVQEEYLVMLELERSYQASSKLIGTIDKMFESLLAVAR